MGFVAFGFADFAAFVFAAGATDAFATGFAATFFATGAFVFAAAVVRLAAGFAAVRGLGMAYLNRLLRRYYGAKMLLGQVFLANVSATDAMADASAGVEREGFPAISSYADR